MRLLLLAGLAILVSTCNSDRPSVVNMSEIELAVYNNSQPAEKRVFCVQETSSSTFIRKRVCQSYEDWVQQNEQNAMTLDVLNSRPSYSLPNSIQDGPNR